MDRSWSLSWGQAKESRDVSLGGEVVVGGSWLRLLLLLLGLLLLLVRVEGRSMEIRVEQLVEGRSMMIRKGNDGHGV